MCQSTLLLLSICCVSFCSSSPDVYRLIGKPAGGYSIEIEIGTPPQTLSVLVDTGSSNFAIASYSSPDFSKYFNSSKSTSFTSQGHSVQVNYTQGHWKGIVGSDLIKFSGGALNPVRASVSLIQESEEFFENGSEWQGILGLGYQKIAISADDDVPTLFIDSLAQSHQVPNSFSMQLCGPEDGPFSDNIAVGGNLTLGDTLDQSQYRGALYKVVVVKEGYYQLLITDIKVGGKSLGLDCVEYNTDKTILDSGTTNLRLPSKVYKSFVERLKAEANISSDLDDNFWNGLNPACIEHEADAAAFYGKFPSIELSILGQDQQVVRLVVAPQQYLRPVVSLHLKGKDCYKVGVETSSSGSVIGAVVMQGYFVYFDREHKTVSFAETTCNPRVTTAQLSTVRGYFKSSNTTTCMYTPPSVNKGLPVYAIVLISVFSCLFGVILGVLIIKLVYKFKSRKQREQSDIDFHNLVDNTFDTDY